MVLAHSGLTGGSQETLNSIGDAAGVDSSTPARIVVVDDEPHILDLVATALRYEGFAVETAASGSQALDLVSRSEPDLVILDVMLPDLDGYAVHRRLSSDDPRVPVIYLTARDGTEDKVRGLTLGGDDYVTKPFSLEELIARVRAVLRRTRGIGGGPSSKLVFEDLELDEDTHEVARAGRPIELTPTEFKLLRYLMLNPRRVLSKLQILDHVWQYDFGGDTNVVETYVSYLRRKVDATAPKLIHTVRGVGYTLRAPAS
jgi:two-component system OmpR family response regulator